MDFRGTYTPLHAFREAYAKARAIGVSLSDSSESDSSDDVRMPSPLFGARRSLNLEMMTEQRLENMDAAQEVQAMTAGGSPRGGISPKPPSSTARRPSVSRVTAFSPKTLAPMSKAAASRLPSSNEQYAAPPPVARTLLSEPPPHSPALGQAANSHNTPPGKQHVASVTGNHLTREEKMVSQVQADMPTNSVSTSEHSNSAGPQEALQDASMQQLQSSSVAPPPQKLSVQSKPQGLATLQRGLDPAVVSSELSGPPPGSSSQPSGSSLGVSPNPSGGRTGVNPKASGGSFTVSPKPSRRPPGVNPQLSGGPSAEPQDWSTLLGQEAVKTPQARVGDSTTDVVTATPPSAAFSRTAPVPFRAAAVPFKPAVVPFRPAAVPSQQAEAATSSSKPVPGALPFKPAAVPFKPAAVPFKPAAVPFKPAAGPFESAAVPLEPAAARAVSEESRNSPAPSLPFELAEVPFETAGLPSVASELPLTVSGSDQAAADLKAASLLVTRPTKAAATQSPRLGQSAMPFSSKAGLPNTSPPVRASLPIVSPPAKVGLPIKSTAPKAGLPITSSTAVTQPAPQAAQATKLPVTPPSSGVPVATGMLSSPHPLPTPSSQSTLLPDQPSPALTAPGTSSNVVTAATTPMALTHQANKQGSSKRAVHSQAPSEAVSDATAVLDNSRASDELTQASSGRRCPRARNQIVHAVTAWAQAVPELVGGGPAVLGQQASAQAASRKFPRARNPIVHAVKGRAGALVYAEGQSVRVEQAAADEEDRDVRKPAVSRLNLSRVSSGSTPITSTPTGPLITPQARSAVGPPSKHTPAPCPQAEPSATPPTGPRAITPGTTPPPSTAGTPPLSTPPPRRTPPQGSLVSEHREKRSASTKKPPLHPVASPGQALKPPAQAGSAAKLSSASASTQTPPGTSDGDSAAAAAAELPKRSPLTQRGLTKQQWAELQHQKATKPARKALSFQYPAGYPWLPEPQQQGLTSVAASEAAQAAAQSPSASATGHASVLSPTVPDRLTGNFTEAAMHKAAVLTGAEGQRSASASGAVLGSGGAVLDALGPNTPYTPPSAGRGSESGVSTSETSSLSAADRLLATPPNASTSSKKTNGAVLPPSEAQAPGSVGRPSPLLKRPGKAGVLAGADGVESPRPPWEIKASAPVTVSTLARKHPAMPGIGSAAVSAAAAATQQPEFAEDHDVRATLSHKSQQRRAQKLTKQNFRGQSKDSRNGWLTAIAMLLLCAGGGFLAAPQSQLPLPAAKLQIAISGFAIQTANRLPHMVPTSNSPPPTEPDSASWQAHSFQMPLRLWHQLKASAMSYLPEAVTAFWSLAPSDHSRVAVPRDVYQVAKHRMSWPSLRQLGGKIAERLPRLAPMGLESSVDEEEWAQGKHAWAQHVVPAAAALGQPLHTTSHLAGRLISKMAAWLLDGLESVKDLAGLGSLQAGDEIRMATSMPEYDSGINSAEQPSVESESASDTVKEAAMAAKPAEPSTSHVKPEVATAQPSAVMTQPAVAPVLPEAPTAVAKQKGLDRHLESASHAASEVTGGPAVVIPEASVMSPDPAVVAAEQAVVTPNPAVVVSAPAEQAPKPPVVVSEPAVVTPEAAVASSEQGYPTGKQQLSGAASAVDAVAPTHATPQGAGMLAALQVAAPDSEAEINPQSLEPLPVDSDVPFASLHEPNKSSEILEASLAGDGPSATLTAQPDSEDAESADYRGLSHFSRESHATLQQLLSWLTKKHWSSRPTDDVSQAPSVTSRGHEQHAESEHTRLAQPESAQLQGAESAQHDSAPGTEAESEGAEPCKPDVGGEQMDMPLLSAAVLPGLQFFLLTAASLLMAWFVSSLLIRSFVTLLTRPTALEAHDEEEEAASPEAAHPASENAEGEQQEEQGVGLATRARSVARSMSEAVSALVTNQPEAQEAEEAGMEAESAPEGSGAGTSRRGRKPKGRRELAALADISEVDMTPRRSRQAPERFTVDSYDGRSKDIRKYHRSETLIQNVDSLSLRNRTVLTPSPTEMAAASNSRELRSLKHMGR